MRRHKNHFSRASAAVFLAVLGLLLLSSCSNYHRDLELLNDSLKPVRDRFAPDRRLAVFSVSVIASGGALVAVGEVDRPEAKAAALQAITEVAGTGVIDSIQVLPDPVLADRR
ncbi:MAG: BON domain-containing protein, partial [Bacteroidota bacterium]